MQTKRTTVLATCQHCGSEYMARKDGAGRYCSRPCWREATVSTPEMLIAARGRDRDRSRAAYEKNHEARLESARRQRTAPESRERALTYARRYYAENRERLLADLRATSAQTRQRRRAYQVANLERYAELARAWRLKNPDRSVALGSKCAAVKFGLVDHFTGQDWATLKARCEYRCLRCERAEPEIKLTVDHIVPMSKGGTNTIDNIQPLCGPCNTWKLDTRIVDFRAVLVGNH